MIEKSDYILEITNLSNDYIRSTSSFFNKTKQHVLKNISLKMKRGEIFGLVGESGCGKSTLGRAIVGLVDTEGEIVIDGESIKGKRSKLLCQKVQMIFQDPLSSLNPCKKVGWILEEPLRIHSIGAHQERIKKVHEVLELVGLDTSFCNRYPRELSGGQRQRVSIGCALMLHPKLIIADEPVSALDVSVQSQILNLLNDLHERLQISYLFISHNLNVIYYLCDRVAVMYLGCIVELAEVEEIYNLPLHPYTKALLSSVPELHGETLVSQLDNVIEGEVNHHEESLSKGCVFYCRCPNAVERCQQEIPVLRCVEGDGQDGHFARCHLI